MIMIDSIIIVLNKSDGWFRFKNMADSWSIQVVLYSKDWSSSGGAMVNGNSTYIADDGGDRVPELRDDEKPGIWPAKQWFLGFKSWCLANVAFKSV